jgi:hypothetical protein
MSQITKDEALRIALEALELHGKQYPHMVKGYCLDAIAAIQQALAVQEPPRGLNAFEQQEQMERAIREFMLSH